MADLTDTSNPSNNAIFVSTATLPSTSSSCISMSNAILNPFDSHLPLLDHECDPLYLIAPQTWAEKNPYLGTQKEHPRAKPMNVAKATKRITAEYNKAQAVQLTTDIETHVLQQKAQVEKIA